MALNNLEDRLECAIRHINTALDIDPWAQNLAVESMRIRIALMKGGQPEIVNCRDCKHWKDSDGIYRRGIGAESKCPINIRAVYEGDFYCALAERKEGE